MRAPHKNALFVAALAVLACVYTGDSQIGQTTGPSTQDSLAPATALTVLEGDGQAAPAGAPLPDPLEVRAVNGSGGSVEGAVIRWTVTRGGGSLESDTSVTNAQGRAFNTLTLGDSLGEQTVIASLQSDSLMRVTFTASATDTGAVFRDGPFPRPSK
jgi:hypothetical protein